MLEFGRELFQMSQRLEKENGANETNRKMLEVSMKIRVAKNSTENSIFNKKYLDCFRFRI